MASIQQNESSDKTYQNPSQNKQNRSKITTEARKQQNRIASKTYREKRKRKLEFLEQLANTQQAAIPVGLTNIVKTTAAIELNSPAQVEINWPEGSQPTLSQGFHPVGWDCHMDTTMSGSDVTNWQYENELHLTSSTGSNSASHYGISTIPFQSNEIDGPLHAAELVLTTFSPRNIDILDNITDMPSNSHSEGFSEDFHTWSSTTLTQLPYSSLFALPRHLTLPSDVSRQNLVSSLPCLRDSRATSVHRLVSLFYSLRVDQRRRILTVIHEKRLKFIEVLTFLADSVENLFTGEPVNHEYLLNCAISVLPSLQLNNLHLTQQSFWAAISANARVLGFQLEDYLDGDAISPIFILSNMLVATTGVGSTTESFSTVPKHLRPSMMQLEKEHHAYLDVLPFPKFRESTLVAVGQDPPLIDEEELCMDLMNDGLVCWGSQDSNGRINACLPWDQKSWEPQVWFLKKYWFLVGGQDDEMWSCTKWWHGMRGEKDL
ncbi:hypothetical protein F5884DRAFT_905534 [Xylogone sp. PMI_703]|nr:hypothetical protein F5884DRAFT_905534 [Xylogone sp. PMI_703]